ncbi:ABC transporter permease [Streptomyces sp. GC420]|uniref:ABC transporter permease n=1 Tax=Streptomyces sp. GC420 TaxID=2697568 RepID=UPI00141523CC|nr:ABC transporter permease [Streptomyces sp. GC420]NBM17684.1 ABC transporter permease [Streptomyces sp. GC420]
MSASSAARTGPASPAARRVLTVCLLVPAVAALALWAFAWPAARIAPRDLPLGVAGAPAAVAQVEQRLAARGGAFELHRYADEAAAREAIDSREVYGAVVVTARGPELLTASAASPVVAQLLREGVAAGLPDGGGPETVDVVPAPDGDPRGAALGAAVLPLALAGVAAGTLVSLLGLRGGRAAAALAGAAALVGVTATALAHSWLGIITGDWWAEAGVFALTALAVGAAAAGLAALLGSGGIGLGALLVVLLGNPFSGASSAPELLPGPVGAIGQWLPPGAGSQMLRSVAFFDGAGAGGPVLVLWTWVALGLCAVFLAGTRRTRRPAPGGADTAAGDTAAESARAHRTPSGTGR